MEKISLTELSRRWQKHQNKNDKIRIGVKVGYSPINHHLQILIRRINQSGRIDGFALTRQAEYDAHKHWYQQEFSGKILITYNHDERFLLEMFDAVLLPESNFYLYEDYPKNLIKIGLPHGVDIPFQKTVMDYGGGAIFDYILSPKADSLRAEPEQYEDIYHQNIRNHPRNYVCQIPFGFPKLDDFIDETTQAEQSGVSSIVHHIAILSIEQEKSIDIIASTLKKLLDNFPDKRIVFRPYKYDREHQVIQQCLRIGAGYQNFYLSTAESYAQDYATALAMVCHRPYKAHLFSLATGRPIFLCHPDENPVSASDPSVEACPESSLIQTLKSYIEKNETITLTQRLDTCRRLGFHNPGGSVEYLVENIDHIIHDKHHQDWNYYRLDSGTPPLEIEYYTAIQVLSAKPANITLNGVFSKYPLRREILLFLADSYSRKTVLLDYYAKLSLKCFYKLITADAPSDTLKAAIGYWWSKKGHTLLQHIIDDQEIHSRDSIEHADALEEGFISNLLLAVKDIRSHEEKSKFQEYGTLIDLSTFQPVAHDRELALYGARRLAHQFLGLQATTSHIRMIVDPDVQIVGTQVGGMTVQHPAALRTCDTPILICSFAYLLESVLELKKTVGPDRKLYAFCKDSQIFNFLPLLQEMRGHFQDT